MTSGILKAEAYDLTRLELRYVRLTISELTNHCLKCGFILMTDQWVVMIIPRQHYYNRTRTLTPAFTVTHGLCSHQALLPANPSQASEVKEANIQTSSRSKQISRRQWSKHAITRAVSALLVSR